MPKLSETEKKSRVAIATNNPKAPAVIEQAYASLNSLGEMLSLQRAHDHSLAMAHVLTIQDQWSNEDFNHISIQPEFVAALSAILMASLLGYTANLIRQD